MTYKSIIKAAECCVTWDCCRCPRALSMPNDKWTCSHQLMLEIVPLLNRIERRTESWNKAIGLTNEMEESEDD